METVLAAVVGGFIGSLAGAAVAGLVALRLARSEPHEDRTSAAYVEMLAMLRQQQVVTGETGEATRMPTDEDVRILSAKIDAAASPEVKRRLLELQEVSRAFPWRQVTDAWEGVRAQQREFHRLYSELQEQVARELSENSPAGPV
jgi:gas vesicle protein